MENDCYNCFMREVEELLHTTPHVHDIRYGRKWGSTVIVFYDRYDTKHFVAIDSVDIIYSPNLGIADDYFFYLTNTGTKDLAITDIRVSTTVAGTLDIKHVSGTPTYVSETAVTPVSRNLGSSKSPSATINTDTDITTLTDEGILFFMDLDTTGKTYRLSTSSNFIILEGQALALMWSEATGILSGVVSLVELP